MITDLESGEIVCGSCGMVSPGQMQDTRRELTENPASGLSNVSGVGPQSSLAMHDMNLSTMIGKSNRDSYGQVILLPLCRSANLGLSVAKIPKNIKINKEIASNF